MSILEVWHFGREAVCRTWWAGHYCRQWTGNPFKTATLFIVNIGLGLSQCKTGPGHMLDSVVCDLKILKFQKSNQILLDLNKRRLSGLQIAVKWVITNNNVTLNVHSLQQRWSRFCRMVGIFSSFQELSIFTLPLSVGRAKSCPRHFVSRPEARSAKDIQTSFMWKEENGGGRETLCDTEGGEERRKRGGHIRRLPGCIWVSESQNSGEQRPDWRHQTNNSSQIK